MPTYQSNIGVQLKKLNQITPIYTIVHFMCQYLQGLGSYAKMWNSFGPHWFWKTHDNFQQKYICDVLDNRVLQKIGHMSRFSLSIRSRFHWRKRKKKKKIQNTFYPCVMFSSPQITHTWCASIIKNTWVSVLFYR